MTFPHPGPRKQGLPLLACHPTAERCPPICRSALASPRVGVSPPIGGLQ